MNPKKIPDSSEVSNITSAPSIIQSHTDWSVDELVDDQIDTSDIPEWTEENWVRAKNGNIHAPRKVKA